MHTNSYNFYFITHGYNEHKFEYMCVFNISYYDDVNVVVHIFQNVHYFYINKMILRLFIVILSTNIWISSWRGDAKFNVL